MKAVFVAGTDTGVGKTVVTGCLARYLHERGYRVITQKWIQTGSPKNFSNDIQSHLKIMGRDKSAIKDYLDLVAPYRFTTASAPHLASQIEKRKIRPDKIIKSFTLLSSQFDCVIVEGIGGILVPLNRKLLLIDIVKDLGLSVLLVSENRLGAINHTLLTLEALKTRKINLLGVIFNNLKKTDKRIIRDNPRIIKALTGQKVLGILPCCATPHQQYRHFIPIGHKIARRLV